MVRTMRQTRQTRRMRRARRTRRRLLLSALTALLLAATALTGCGVLGDDAATGAKPRAKDASSTASSEPSPSTDPDAPSGWGPTMGELDQARAMVADLTDEEKVATVLMPGFWGYDGEEPTPAEAAQNELMHGVGSAVESDRTALQRVLPAAGGHLRRRPDRPTDRQAARRGRRARRAAPAAVDGPGGRRGPAAQGGRRRGAREQPRSGRPATRRTPARWPATTAVRCATSGSRWCWPRSPTSTRTVRR